MDCPTCNQSPGETMNCTQDRADYLILQNGGSLKRIENCFESLAKYEAEYYAQIHGCVTLVKVIGTVEVVTQWKDAK